MKTAQDFIDFFEKIPEDEWFVGDFVNPENPKQKCAFGHCGARNTDDEAIERVGNFAKLIRKLGRGFDINDGIDPTYQQPTPKQRILAALRDVKESGL